MLSVNFCTNCRTSRAWPDYGHEKHGTCSWFRPNRVNTIKIWKIGSQSRTQTTENPRWVWIILGCSNLIWSWGRSRVSNRDIWNTLLGSFPLPSSFVFRITSHRRARSAEPHVIRLRATPHATQQGVPSDSLLLNFVWSPMEKIEILGAKNRFVPLLLNVVWLEAPVFTTDNSNQQPPYLWHGGSRYSATLDYCSLRAPLDAENLRSDSNLTVASRQACSHPDRHVTSTCSKHPRK